jgi:hypothetical protein
MVKQVGAVVGWPAAVAEPGQAIVLALKPPVP